MPSVLFSPFHFTFSIMNVKCFCNQKKNSVTALKKEEKISRQSAWGLPSPRIFKHNLLCLQPPTQSSPRIRAMETDPGDTR